MKKLIVDYKLTKGDIRGKALKQLGCWSNVGQIVRCEGPGCRRYRQ